MLRLGQWVLLAALVVGSSLAMFGVRTTLSMQSRRIAPGTRVFDLGQEKACIGKLTRDTSCGGVSP